MIHYFNSKKQYRWGEPYPCGGQVTSPVVILEKTEAAVDDRKGVVQQE
jgi:hypothetical protein